MSHSFSSAFSLPNQQQTQTLHAGYKPFQGVSYEGIAAAVIQHAMADLPPHLSPVFKSFIAAALTYDPQQRPSAQQLLDHPWIQVWYNVQVVHRRGGCRSALTAVKLLLGVLLACRLHNTLSTFVHTALPLLTCSASGCCCRLLILVVLVGARAPAHHHAL